jgi:hypothetical protein
MGKVTRAEWRWVGIFAGVVSLLLILPYLAGYASQNNTWRFSGFLFGVEDGNSYIADMRQGAEGAWLFRIPYTSEAQSGTLIYLPYLVLGKLAGGAAMHEQLVALFQLARIAAGIFLMFAVYRFLSCFLKEVSLRRWGLAAVCFGGGFGWILLAKPSYPLEFTSPEAFGFLSLFGIPHLAVAKALLLLALVWWIEPAASAQSMRHGLKVGAALAGVWLFQPLTVIIAWTVMAVCLALLFLRSRLRRSAASSRLRELLVRALIAAAVTIPLMLYTALSFLIDPVLRQWGAQNVLPSPPVGEYLLSFAVLLLPALGGAWIALREDDRWMLPIGWALAVPVLIYLPIAVQRRMVDGFWAALAVLALLFVEKVWKGRTRRAAFVIGMTLLLPATALFGSGVVFQSLAPSTPVFLPAEEVRAFEWLDAHAEPGALVLANFDAGNALPAYADLVSFIGHGPETLDLSRKTVLVQTVFDGGLTNAERWAALRQTGARYVLAGPEERVRMGAGIPGCRLVYDEGGWEVWKVGLLVLPSF